MEQQNDNVTLPDTALGSLTLCIYILDFPMHVDRICMGLPIVI